MSLILPADDRGREGQNNGPGSGFFGDGDFAIAESFAAKESRPLARTYFSDACVSAAGRQPFSPARFSRAVRKSFAEFRTVAGSRGGICGLEGR